MRDPKKTSAKALVALLAVVFSAWAVPHFAPGIWGALTGRDPVNAYVSYADEISPEPAFVIPLPVEQIPVPPVDAAKRYAWAEMVAPIPATSL